MALLSKTSEYALRAAVCLAKQAGEPIVTSRLAELTQVPAGYLLWRGRRVGSGRRELPDSDAPAVRLASYHFIADVVRWYPQAVEVLAASGFTPIRNPVLRATLARRVTLAQAAMMGRVPLAQLLAALNEAIGAPSESEATAMSCSGDCQHCPCHGDHADAHTQSQPVGGHL